MGSSTRPFPIYFFVAWQWKRSIEEIFGNKVNNKNSKFFFHLIFHFTVKICFLSLLLNCSAAIHFFVTYWEKTFDRPRRCVCQVYPCLGKNVMLARAPTILHKPSQGSVVSRPLTVNQVNSRRFIDWFLCCVQRYGVIVLQTKNSV